MDVDIRFARSKEFPELIEMWKICFHDTDEGANHVFSKLQKPENILVLTEDGHPASMLSIQEFSLASPAVRHKAAYVYAVATFPEHQKKGYSTKLLDYMDSVLKRRDFACAALVPAEKSLFGFYERRGYETAFNINKATVNTSQICKGESLDLKPVKWESFVSARDARFGDSKMLVCWDGDYLKFIMKDCRYYGGDVLGFEDNAESGYAVCYNDGEIIYVKEFCFTEKMHDIALRSLKNFFSEAEKFVFYLREDVKTSYTNNLLPFGMVKWYDSNVKTEMENSEGAPPYIAHVLD